MGTDPYNCCVYARIVPQSRWRKCHGSGRSIPGQSMWDVVEKVALRQVSIRVPSGCPQSLPFHQCSIFISILSYSFHKNKLSSLRKFKQSYVLSAVAEHRAEKYFHVVFFFNVDFDIIAIHVKRTVILSAFPWIISPVMKWERLQSDRVNWISDCAIQNARQQSDETYPWVYERRNYVMRSFTFWIVQLMFPSLNVG